jgi:hypothetical protein
MAEPPAASASRPSDFSGDYVDAPMESTHLRLPRTIHTPAPHTCTQARDTPTCTCTQACDTPTCRPAPTEACPPVYLASHRLVARRLATGLVSLRLRVHNVRLTKLGPLRARSRMPANTAQMRSDAPRASARFCPLSSASPTSCRGSAGGKVLAAMRSIEHLLCSELPNASKEGTVCRTARNPWADVASARRGRLGAGPAWMWPVSAGANAGPFMPGADVGEAPGCSQKYLAPCALFCRACRAAMPRRRAVPSATDLGATAHRPTSESGRPRSIQSSTSRRALQRSPPANRARTRLGLRRASRRLRWLGLLCRMASTGLHDLASDRSPSAGCE